MASTQRASFASSTALLATAQRSVAGGVTSTVRATTKPHPVFFERGEAARLIDVDGQEYVDFVLGYGPLLLGHNPGPILDSISRESRRPMLSGGQHRFEEVVASQLRDAVPGAGRVCFSSTGTEAVMTAIRIARVATSRTRIVKFEGHYHGWSDAVAWSTPGLSPAQGSSIGLEPVRANAGVPADTAPLVLRWNDRKMLQAFLAEPPDDIACVILEPVPQVGLLTPDAEFLESVLAGFQRIGALVIFDEVVTGFRLGRGGAQESLGVQADLVVFAKALGGGMPISAVTGRDELMEYVAAGAMPHLGTFNGHAPSFAAASAALSIYASASTYASLNRITTALELGLRELGGPASGMSVRRVGAMLWTEFDAGPNEPTHYAQVRAGNAGKSAAFAAELLERGVHIQPRGTWMTSTAHAEADIERALSAVEGALQAIERIESA